MLAERAGISKRAIQYIESGQRATPYIGTLHAISDALGVSLDMITYRDES